MTARKKDCADAYPSDLSSLAPHLPDAGRRRLLKLLGATGATGAASGWLAPLSALAQTVTNTPATANDYKALVCVFLYGGNDGNNLLIPYESAEFATYQKGRGKLALRYDDLQPLNLLNTGGLRYALHPAMGGLSGLVNAGSAAVVANVGTLVAPTTKAQYQARSVPLPQALFSHSDQQAQWQSAIYDGSGRSGWGGRTLERLLPEGTANRGYACLSVAGGNLWENSDQSLVAYKVAANGDLGFDFYDPKGGDTLSLAIQQTLAEKRGHPMEQAWLDVMQRSIDVQQVLSSALQGSALGTAFPNSGLGQQLQTVARLIRARGTLGLTRQVFFCSLGGFDTHGDDQLDRQRQLLDELSAAVTAFQAANVEMGSSQQVTLFTASDFGRTLTTNGQGSDHAWGSHHVVVGGAVQGQTLHGRFPDLTVGGPDDADQGRWIPSTSTDQLGGALASWMGADASMLPALFPNLGNFSSNLGLFRTA